MKDFFGQEEWVSHFHALVKKQRMGHAYLFTGPAHLGKRTFARKLAGDLLKVASVVDQVHPDYLELVQPDDELVTPIETVRSFVQALQVRPQRAAYRVALITNATRLSTQSLNLLLKTLEEPPVDTILLVCAEEPELLPATVRSRLSSIVFRPVDVPTLAEALQMYTNKQEAKEVAALAAGRPGLALTFLRDKTARKQYEQDARAFLDLLAAPLVDRFSFTESVAKESQMARSDLVILLEHWLLVLHDALLVSVDQAVRVRHAHMQKALMTFMVGKGSRYVVKVIDTLQLALQRIQKNGNRRLAINSFWLSF